MLTRPLTGIETPTEFADVVPAWAKALAYDQEVQDLVHGFLRLREPSLRRIAIRLVRSLGAEG